MKQLRVLVKSVCLRRTKKTKIDGQPILQLPPKVIEKIHVIFNEEEKGLYEELNSDSQNQIRKYLNAGTLGKNYSHVLVLLLRLRQACDHPLLIKGFNAENSTVIQGVDLVANAKLLDDQTVERIKNNKDDDDGTCPICMDSPENPVIYIPCGHSSCSECFAKISDPTLLAHQDSALVKCQNCRGEVDPTKVTDAVSFNKAHVSGAESPEVEESEQSEDTDSESDSDTETDGSGKKRKKKSLAELRTAAQRNKAEKRKYFRRLEKHWTPSAKITKAIEILQANEDRGVGDKTIIFSQFTSLLDLLEVPIAREGWGWVRFDGTMNVHDRNAAVASFTDNPDCRIMLVSLKAGNAGLNLIAASHVILFDPFWNPYVEDQAIDRAHRIGQTKDVFVHRLLIEGTVEDRIIELQEKKRELIEGALDEGGSMNVSRLGTRELAYLFVGFPLLPIMWLTRTFVIPLANLFAFSRVFQPKFWPNFVLNPSLFLLSFDKFRIALATLFYFPEFASKLQRWTIIILALPAEHISMLSPSLCEFSLYLACWAFPCCSFLYPFVIYTRMQTVWVGISQSGFCFSFRKYNRAFESY